MRFTRSNATNFASLILLCIALLFGNYSLQAQNIAFPGAEGFGKYATGGRGGTVIKVTNLNDSGEGSLRWAITQNYPRIIVFEVSGTIYLKSRLKISNGNVTVAGQTAPGHGITLAHYNFYVEAENVIIRYIRSRLSAEANQQDDAFNCIGCTNVIVDHCSFSWSVDEVASIYHNTRLTLQNCIVAESFYNSIHEKGLHGYGGIWGGDSTSFHHNLIMHNTSRNPRLHGARWYTNWEEHVDFRNNVIYNWQGNSIYGGEPSELDGSPVFVNIVNNYYKYGPATNNSIRDRILDPDQDATYGYGKYYINGNYVYGYETVTANNWLGVDDVSESVKALIKSDTAFAYDITTIQTAEEAYAFVLENVGANIPYRDTIDSRMVWEVANDTALCGGSFGANTGIVDNLEDVGGYPDLFSNWAPTDTDNDGIPDVWETANGLNPNDASDNDSILSGKTYPAIEEYINNITASHDYFMFQPNNLTAVLTDLSVITLNWSDNSDDETAFLLWRSGGDDFSCIDTLAANTTTYADTNITYDMTYTYKVQAINETDSSVYSNEASASTLGADGRPKPAANPTPSASAKDICTTVTLTWDAGVGAKSHNLYIGTTSSNLSLIGNFAQASSTVTDLLTEKRYYWRVDEVNENGATTGSLWNFVTRSAFQAELIAHFAFNNAIVVDDVSGNSISGTPVNIKATSFVTGHSGKAINFDGSSQYIEYSNNAKLDFDLNAFTISFWINQDSSTINRASSQRYIVKGSNIADETAGHSGKRYEVYYTPDDSLFRFCVDDNVMKSEITAHENIFINNSWVHVVAVRDTANKQLNLYANAQLVGQVDDATGNIAEDEPMYISYCVDETGYVDGIMDEVKLYGYALTPEQVESLYINDEIIETVEDTVTEDTLSVENILNSEFLLYPNPATGKVTIKSTNNNIQAVNVTDILGRTLYYEAYKTGTSSLDLNLESINKQGQNLLIVKVNIEGQVFYKKLIIN